LPRAQTREEPDEQVLINLYTARTREEGGLLFRVAKGPREPKLMTPQQQQEVRTRLKTGDNIARGYGVDVDTIKRLARG
jgi:transposase